MLTTVSLIIHSPALLWTTYYICDASSNQLYYWVALSILRCALT